MLEKDADSDLDPEEETAIMREIKEEIKGRIKEEMKGELIVMKQRIQKESSANNE